MREQKGSIVIHRGSWILRWREYSEDGQGNRIAKRRFRVLGEVEAGHRRNLKRIPKNIQDEAANILEPLNEKTTTSISGTIGELKKEYLKTKLLKPSTLQAYKNYWNRFLEKRIGHLAISGFRRVDAFALWKQIHDANPHLSRATMNKIRFIVSGLFEFAKNTGRYFGENPALADLPEGLPGKKETGAYNIEEVNTMLSVLDSPLARAIVALAFASGLRKGEIAGLDWRDYQPTTEGGITTGATLHVRRSVWQGHVTTPKTESSADVVEIGPSAVEYLEGFRERVGKPAEGYMFGYDAKHPINLSSFARWAIRPVLKTA
jgi:integrase